MNSASWAAPAPETVQVIELAMPGRKHEPAPRYPCPVAPVSTTVPHCKGPANDILGGQHTSGEMFCATRVPVQS